MSYATGDYTGMGDVLDLFAAWVENTLAGATNPYPWTINHFDVEGTGKRLHIQKEIDGKDFFFNFRTATTHTGFGHTYASNAMFVNGSTKFDMADPWDRQGLSTTNGYTTNSFSSTDAGAGVIESLKTSGGVYHFFSTPTNVTAVFETNSHLLDWRMLTVGSLGGYTAYFSSGGELASYFSETWGDARSSYCTETYQGSGSYSNPDNQASVFVPGEGWYGMVQYHTGARCTHSLVCKRPATSALQRSVAGPIVMYSPDSFRGNAQLAPSSVAISKGLTAETWPVADIEGVKFVNMKNYTNGQEITYDADVYVLFRINNAANGGVAFLK